MTKFSKNHPVWSGIIGLVLLVIIVSALGGGSSDKSTTPTTSAADTSANTAPAQTTPVHPDEDSQPGNLADESDADSEDAAPSEPSMTPGQENALESAQNYIDLGGFSKQGLIEQLSSSAGDGFSKADATYAANHVGADWKQEAVESAQSYLDMSGFSRSGLIEQLTSDAGDGFTPAQARYAVDKVYR
jgi:hypothetical protein